MELIICDDSKEDREILRLLLKKYGQQKDLKFEITEYATGIELCEHIAALENCQILFWDINMEKDEIIYIETAKHKNIFYTRKQTYSIYQKLDEIETKLQGMGFVRAHLSFLVNMRYIEKISSYVMKLKKGKAVINVKMVYEQYGKRENK